MKPCDLVVQEYPIPFKLRQDQVDAINTVCESGWSRAALFMDVGVGKTVTATLITLWRALAGEVDRVLIIMPPILLDQWAEWFEEFPDLTLETSWGSKAKRKKINLDVDVLLTTPGMFKNDFEILKEFHRHEKTMLIVDEAAMLRRISTLLYAAVREFTHTLENKSLLMLTGTALGAPAHAYGYISLKTPEIYRDHLRFVLKHVEYTDQYGEPSKYKNLDLLTENLMKQTIWTKAEDVLDLPKLTCSAKVYSLSPAHYKLYNDLVEEKLLELDDGQILDGTIPERLRHTCQKAILSPAVYGGEKIEPNGYQLIDNFVEELGITAGAGEKLIIYCNYNVTNEAVYEYVTKKLKLNAVLAYGVSGPKKNLESLNKFLTDPSVQILVAHPISIGVGINAQKVCRAALFLEIPLTSNQYIQAVGRIKREGQTRPIIVWLATAKRTIQVSLRRTVTRSEDLVQQILPTKDSMRKALFGEEC